MGVMLQTHSKRETIFYRNTGLASKKKRFEACVLLNQLIKMCNMISRSCEQNFLTLLANSVLVAYDFNNTCTGNKQAFKTSLHGRLNKWKLLNITNLVLLRRIKKYFH